MDNGKILLKCHAGCTVEQIVSSIGLKLSYPFENTTPIKKKVVAEYLYKDLEYNLTTLPDKGDVTDFYNLLKENAKFTLMNIVDNTPFFT